MMLTEPLQKTHFNIFISDEIRESLSLAVVIRRYEFQPFTAVFCNFQRKMPLFSAFHARVDALHITAAQFHHVRPHLATARRDAPSLKGLLDGEMNGPASKPSVSP